MFSIEKLTLDILGFYPHEGRNMLHWKPLIMVTYIIINTLQMFLTLIFVQLEEPLRLLMLCLIYVTFILKLITFLYHGNALRELEKSLEQPIFTRIPKGYSKLFEANSKFTNRLANYNRISILLYASYFCFYRTFFNSQINPVPMDGILPCNTQHGICFVTVFLFQTFSIFVSVLVNTNLECLFSKLITICFCLFRVVEERLKDIDYTSANAIEVELRQIVRLHVETLRLVFLLVYYL